MKSFLFLTAIIILIGGTYSIGFYNGNNNANSKVDIAISGGKEFMKIYPPDGSNKKSKSDSGTELTDEEKEIIQKVKSGDMSMDEVPEDLRNKIRTGFVSENKPATSNLPKNQLGNRGLRTMTGTVTDIQNNTIYVETQMGNIQVIMDEETNIKSIVTIEKSELKIDNKISISGSNDGAKLKALEITITN
jgi:hypothetical protein